MADTANESAALQLPTPYGYTPTTWICILFVVLYSITSLVHLGQAIRSSLWWMIPTVVTCGLIEAIGWSGRLWSSYDVQNINPFLMQITTTILAPSFLTAAVFNILGHTIRRVGTQYSWLPPRWYLIIFMALDLTALIVQAIGGGTASIAAQNGGDPEPGGNIMMYGIVVQMVGMTLFCILGADFLIRFYWNRPVRPAPHTDNGTSSFIPNPSEKPSASARAIPVKVRLMLLGAGVTTVWVFIRSIYRTIELADGWTGRIITTQVYFNVLDGAPIVLAMVTLNVFHPGWLLREENNSDPEKMDKMDKMTSESGSV